MLAGRGARVLAVSTDPAHSLGDALGVRLSSRARVVPGAGRGPGTLHALELDAPRAFARWLADHRHALSDVLEHGTWLDRHDVDAVLDLPVPGVDELVGLTEMFEAAAGGTRRRPYDEVVVDTAPTGHTLRLLNTPDTVAAVAETFEALQQEHRLVRRQFARDLRPEAADRLIALMARQARDTSELLRDAARTRFEWVLLPEELSIEESIDGLHALERARIPVSGVIVNRVVPPGEPCPVCDRRRADEWRAIARIRRTVGLQRTLRVIPAEVDEPRGLAGLRRIARQLARPASGPGSVPIAPGNRAARPAQSIDAGRRRQAAESVAALRGARLLFFGGKGGVGKTTVSAAAAVRLARANRSARVLLLSTDPAHSLADVFGAPVHDEPATIPGAPSNLLVRELDAAAALAARRVDLEAALGDIMEATSGEGAATRAAGLAVGQLMELAPPGIDELFGMLTVVQAQREYSLVVIDTAPTGHALRLLEMPDAARGWVQMLLRLLLKYRSLVRPGQLASELVDLSKSIRSLQDLMHDPEATRFIVVTRPTAVTRLETARLLEHLNRLRLAAPAIVMNALTLAPGRCRRCLATARAERQQMALLRKRCRPGECVIIQTPLAAPPPRGVAALDRWARNWTFDA